MNNNNLTDEDFYVWKNWILIKSGMDFKLYENGIFEKEVTLDHDTDQHPDSQFIIGANYGHQ